MLISIGILARNEEKVIEATLTSLLRQSVFRQISCDLPDTEWEIVVVPNGCTDATSAVAQRVLKELVHQTANGKVSFAIRELVEPGKSNAWNHFVHEFSSTQAKLILMMDADIEFGQPETISNTVQALLHDPDAVVAVDLPLKDAVRKKTRSLIERISVSASGTTTVGPPGICGQFFCARAETLRQIWMPKGLPVDDGFLRAMIVTDCFRSAYDGRKIIRAANASHYFRTLTTLPDIFRHELRLVIGTTLNCYLNWDFLVFATDPAGPGAGILIRNLNKADSSWFARYVENTVRNRGFWVLPGDMLFRRFATLSRTRGKGLPRRLFIAAAGFMLDLPVFIVANRKLKKNDGIGFW